MIDLKGLAGKRYRVALDKSRSDEPSRAERLWLYQIPCMYGHIGVWGENTLSAYTDRKLVMKRLAAISGAKVVQQGDSEVQVTFPPERLHAVAQLLRARVKRQVSEEDRQKLIARLAARRFSPHTGRAPGAPRDFQSMAPMVGPSAPSQSRGELQE